MRSGNRTHTVRLTPVRQIGIGAALVTTIGWLSVTSAAFFLNFVQADGQDNQIRVMQEAYEARLEAVTAERDTRRIEADRARERFLIATRQLSLQQSEMLDVFQERRELQTGIQLMRVKLQSAVDERDLAATQSTKLLTELTALSSDIGNRTLGQDDLTGTLATIADALGTTVKVRDQAMAERDALRAEIVAMDLRIQVNSERQDNMITRLEEAVTLSFPPLEKMFESSGLDVDTLIASIRRSHSGSGGPLSNAEMNEEAFADPIIGARFAALMEGIDRVNMMRIAGTKLPYAVPVRASFRYTSGFGIRNDPKNGGRRAHNGLDLAGSHGTPIYSSGDGVVVFAGRQSGYGNLVKVRHDFGFETAYAHMSEISVKVGERISRGDQVGAMGNTGRSTGTHLHYEIRRNGVAINPMNFMGAARDVF